MSLTDELQKLETLHRNGTLTDAEFVRAKAALLAQFGPAAPDAGDKLAEHLAEVRYQNELARIDREWAQEREQYLVTGKNGHRSVPTVAGGRVAAVAIGVFGAFWTVTALAITGRAPDEMPFSLVKVMFPLFGVAFTAGGVWLGLRTAQNARAYTDAHAAYQRRRAAVTPENVR